MGWRDPLPFRIGQECSFTFTQENDRVVTNGFIVDGFRVESNTKFRKGGEYRVLILSEGRYFERNLKKIVLL